MLKRVITFTCALQLLAPGHIGSRAAQVSLISGTAVVAINTGAELIVAADSKEATMLGPNVPAPSGLCKIRRSGDAWFSCAGLTRSTDESFNLLVIAAEACRAPGNIEAKALAFERKVKQPFEAILERSKKLYPQEYARKIDGKVAADVIFFGLEGDALILFRVTLTAISSPGAQVSLKAEPKSIRPGKAALMGEVEEMEEYAARHRPASEAEVVPLAIKLVEVAIQAHPGHVSPPVDVLRMDKKGVGWIQCKPECRGDTPLVSADQPSDPNIPSQTQSPAVPFGLHTSLSVAMAAFLVLCGSILVFRRYRKGHDRKIR
jgi:hypothetical protein